MFEKILKWMRQLLAGTAVEKQPPPALLSGEMEAAISRWAAEYDGTPAWDPTGKNGLYLAAAICREIARMVTMESEITVSGGSRAAWLLQSFSPVRQDLPVLVEQAAALGSLLLRPYITADGRCVVDAVQGDSFFPLAFDSSRRLTGAVLVDQVTRGREIFTRCELHEYAAGAHSIRNRAFKSTTAEALGREIDLAAVPEWAELAPEVVIRGVDRPLFAYFRMPFANRVDRRSPLGVSVFAGAENLLRDADLQYGRYLWEFEGGELAVHVESDLLRVNPASGQLKPDKGRERLYRGLETRTGTDNFYQVFSPALRDESLKRGLNTILQRLEFNCGLAYGTLSDPAVVEKTAEEIRAGKQRSYNTIHSVQAALEAAVTDLVYAMDKLAGAYAVPESGSGTYELAFDWDDSITNDPQQRKQTILQLVTAGKFPLWRYLMEFEGYSEEDARAAVQEAADEMNTGEPLTFEGA